MARYSQKRRSDPMTNGAAVGCAVHEKTKSSAMLPRERTVQLLGPPHTGPKPAASRPASGTRNRASDEARCSSATFSASILAKTAHDASPGNGSATSDELRQRHLHVYGGGIDAPMAQEIRDLVDRATLPDELCRQAMAQQMGARDAGKLNPASLQSRSHDPRNGGAGP